MEEETEKNLEEARGESLIKFLKQKKDFAVYIALAFIVWLGVYIRTRNMTINSNTGQPKLWDITTNSWTLGPDLDPFLFLRWMEYILEHGKLMAVDVMRYIPLGYDTAGEMRLLPYMMAWTHKILEFLSLTDSITYSAVIFPVIMFIPTTIAFFLFARKIFYKEERSIQNLIALLATAIFVLIPSLLPRTIAGIPEKESVAFGFMFLSFYFFMEAFTSEKLRKGLIFGVLAGLSNGLMALVWGGTSFIFMAIGASVLLSFVLGKVKKEKFYIYCLWLFASFALMIPFSTRYMPILLIKSVFIGFAIGVFALIGLSFLLMKIKKVNEFSEKTKIPKELFYVVVSFIIILLIILITPAFGPDFIFAQINKVKINLVEPFNSRFSLTVAENKQPFFSSEWKDNFGPIVKGIPLYFWMFFAGSVFLFSRLVSNLKRSRKIILISGCTIFLFSIIFSRYSASFFTEPGLNRTIQTLYFGGFLLLLIGIIIYSYTIRKQDKGLFYLSVIPFMQAFFVLMFFTKKNPMNGTNIGSLFVQFGGWVFLFAILSYVYWKHYKEGEMLELKKINFSYILYFVVLVLGIIGARGAIRLMMSLGAVSPAVIAFFVIKTSQIYFQEKKELRKVFFGIAAILLIIITILIIIGNPLLFFKGIGFNDWNGNFQQVRYTAEFYVPGPYQWQWQRAMEWVRTNTPENAVFAHWWDYGYWLQSIGKRATVLDGGNSIVYWNHLLGRHVLTGSDERTALEFLYTHNATHLLIDSTDIGKYTAFSSIGADENYDRFSWIPSFIMDDSKTQEAKDGTTYWYVGGATGIDEDITWNDNGKEIFLPGREAVIVAFSIKTKSSGQQFSQPTAVFIYGDQQYNIPLRYISLDDTGKFSDFGSGLDAGVFIFPKINSIQGQQVNMNYLGAALYLSKRTIHSQLTKLYLFDETSRS